MPKYTKQAHDCLVELWKWRKSFRGAGVRNTRQGVIIAPPPARRVMPFDGGGSSSGMVPVLLQRDGGDDGNAEEFVEASWTYTLYDINTGTKIATQVPLYGHRPLVQTTTPASCGIAYQVADVSNVGFGGSAGYGPNGPSSGSSGSGTGSDSGNLWRIFSCDEQFPMESCGDDTTDDGSGDGSGSGPILGSGEF